jgi:hypothetical protein
MMNYIILSALLSQAALNDTLFRSTEGGFEVRVPGEMVHHIEEITTEIGKIDYHSYYYNDADEHPGHGVYVISYYESEALEIPQDSLSLINDFFDNTVQQAALSLSGEVLILSEETYRGKYPGRFWRIHYNDGQSVMKTKAFLVGNRYYSIQVAVDAKYSLSESIDTFMDSFRIIDIID